MKTVYNEIDPFAAEWLENLANAGEISAGVVDRRSIKDLKGGDCGEVTHLFAGVAGWPLALRLAGWKDEWPVWSGSAPCQPYSAAGKGKGDADERNLWPEMYRLIRECRPSVCFGEQVQAAIGHGWIDRVRIDMEKEGYAFGFLVLPSASVGAPHIRQRIFWVADLHESGRERTDGAGKPRVATKERSREIDLCGSCGNGRMADVLGAGCERRQDTAFKGESAESECSEAGRINGRLADADQSQFRGQPRAGEQSQHEQDGRTGGMEHADAGGLGTGSEQPIRQFAEAGAVSGLGDTSGKRSQKRRNSERTAFDLQREATERASPWDDYLIIHCKDGKSRRVGCSVQPLAHGIPVNLGLFVARLREMGLSSADVKLARRNRTGRLKGYGNAINTVLAAVFIRAFMETKLNCQPASGDAVTG